MALRGNPVALSGTPWQPVAEWQPVATRGTQQPPVASSAAPRLRWH
jgi:hypothetical protein